MTPDTFGKNRGLRLDDVDKELLPIVTKALKNWTAKGAWYSDIVEAASVLWLEMFEQSVPEAEPKERDALLAAFQKDLRTTLAKTSNPKTAAASQAQTITEWVSTSTSNHAELRAARVNKHPALRWVTRRDDRVRSSHRAIDGTTVPAGQTFKVGDVHLAYPGEPIGDPSNWIRCRCLLQRVGEGKSMAGNVTAFTEGDLFNHEGLKFVVDEDARTLTASVAAEKTPATAEGAEPDELTTEDVHKDDTIDVVVGTETPFHGVAAPVDIASGDGRLLVADGFSTRPFPLFLNYQRGSYHGGDPGPAVTVGRIDAMTLDPETGLVRYSGVYSPNIPESGEAIQHVVDGTITGVSVDLSDTVVEQPDLDDEATMAAVQDGTYVSRFLQWRVAGVTMVAFPAFEQAFIALGPEDVEAEGDSNVLEDGFGDSPEAQYATLLKDGLSDHEARQAAFGSEYYAPGTHDGPGWITDPVPTARIRRYWVRGKGAAKIGWGVPGDFNRCRANLAKYVKNPDWLAGLCANMHKEATGVWPGQEDGGRHHSIVAAGAKMAASINLVASAATEIPPGEWFFDPELTGPTPFTVLDDGRVFGHVATWGTCHIGFDQVCTTAPSSASSYAYYRTGEIETTLGPAAVGQVTMGAGHADMRAGAQAAAAHYDNVAHAVADVAAGEDAHGIWVAGALRPGVSDEDVRALRAASLSGDWRRIRGNMEMVAALAVNVPGFPIPRNALAASGAIQTSLVAAGVVEDAPPPPAPTDTDQKVADLMERIGTALADAQAAISDESDTDAEAAALNTAQQLVTNLADLLGVDIDDRADGEGDYAERIVASAQRVLARRSRATAVKARAAQATRSLRIARARRITKE